MSSSKVLNSFYPTWWARPSRPDELVLADLVSSSNVLVPRMIELARYGWECGWFNYLSKYHDPNWLWLDWSVSHALNSNTSFLGFSRTSCGLSWSIGLMVEPSTYVSNVWRIYIVLHFQFHFFSSSSTLFQVDLNRVKTLNNTKRLQNTYFTG